MFKGKFIDIVEEKDGFLRGPFGSALKKSLFVPKSVDTYKVYEQSVVLEQNKNLGNYYISKEYFDTSLKNFEVKEGDFLVSCSGVNYGAIYQLTGEIEKGVINQALLRIRINKEIVDENYFLYYFRSYIVKVITSGTGDSTIPNFPSMSVIKNIKIELPEIEQQRKIGKTLKLLDTKIENNMVVNIKLQNMLQTIYNYYFLQFDFPNDEGKPYKTSAGKMVWNKSLNREIPYGWDVQNLKENDLTQILSPGIEKFKGSKTYLATGDVENNNIVSGKNITYENRESRANMQPIPNTVWFAKMKNSIKHIFVGEYSKSLIEKYIFSTGFLGLKCVDRKNFEYINCFINSEFFELQKDKLAHGATQEAVNNNDIRLIPLIIPDNEVLEKFHERTKDILQKIYLNNLENEELKRLRDFLLPLLMNGQVKL